MKKYIPYLFVTILLAIAAIWFVWHRSANNTDFDEKAFQVSSASDITKVILTDTEKKRIKLDMQNGAWIVNGKYPARPELIQDLFEALTREIVLSPLQKAAHDNVMRQMLDHNVKVEVYLKDSETPAKVFYVGGATPDVHGTYMISETDGQPDPRPSIVYIPGQHAYLTPRFNTDEITWRSKLLFNYQRGDIKSLSVDYSDKDENSFNIQTVAKDSFVVTPHNDKYSIHENYQQKYVRQYLDFYSSIFIEAYNNDYIHRDSVIQTVPYCTITIVSNNDSVNKVKLFRMPVSQRSKSQFDINGKEMTYDVDHFFAAINNHSDFTVVQYYVFGKLLRNYKDFFFKPVK